MSKKALITGVSGQDGAYLAQFLLDQGYEVFGAYRRSSSPHAWRLRELGIEERVKFVPIDLLEYSNIQSLVREIRPNEFYNLGAQSFVAESFAQPLYTSDVGGLGVLRCLQVIRDVDPEIRFYQASTSEMFGKAREVPQNESTPFYPRSPYGVAKLFGHWITTNYRESYGIHATSGILFNHESPLRGMEFVTRKITHTLALIRHGQANGLQLGNIESCRDWGYAGDYVRGMWLMVQSEPADDFVLATGKAHSVREFVDRAAKFYGFDLEWSGEGVGTQARDRKTGKLIVSVNPQFYRPAEVDHLVGNPAKARSILGWQPETDFDALVEMMARSDFDRVASGKGVY